jgi:rhodanese-related sulfurtransferase
MKVMDFEITAEETKQKVDAKEAVLLDVREPWEVATASVAGARVIPMGELQARVQELDPEDHILVMCHHGVRSLKVTSWLRQQGYERVQSVRGGIASWSRNVDPKVPTY